MDEKKSKYGRENAIWKNTENSEWKAREVDVEKERRRRWKRREMKEEMS